MNGLREVATCDDPNVEACTIGGVDHDWRPHEGVQFNRPHTWWRCVWCHAVSCGNYGTSDPCMEAYHHRTPHRSRSGITWPIGGDRPDRTTQPTAPATDVAASEEGSA